MSADSSHQGDWQRVSRSRPCSICRKPDWCAFSDGIALCMRVESPTPSRGDAGGWLHYESDTLRQPTPRRLRFVAAASIDFVELTERFSAAAKEGRVVGLAAQLGVSVEALFSTGIGWCENRRAWSWPMHDHLGRVVGIRLRDARTHQKYAVPGSKQGVFLTDCAMAHNGGSRVLVTEGPTDLCAAMDLGFPALGRPSCTGGTKHVVEMTRGDDVVVVADGDEPGRRGAQSLAVALLPSVRCVRVIEPPTAHKDLRGWLQAGATPEDIEARIEAAPQQTLRVRIRR